MVTTTITSTDPKYWVIIPAAGMGRRMQSKTPKQYHKLNDQTILEHTVSLFSSHPLIEKVVVVLHENDKVWSTLNIQHPEKVVATVGGDTRAHSVLRGLAYLESTVAVSDWVLVHDAARPCLPSTVLDRFIKTLADHPVGGLLAMPITDTVKKVDANHDVRETISREGLWAAQTPQMFRFDLLFDAMQKALSSDAVVTDEASAIEFVGEHPLVVEGDWRNIKITTPEDLERACVDISKS